MISALCIAFLSLCDIISKGYTYPLEWWEITLIAVELAIELVALIVHIAENKGYLNGYRDALKQQDEIVVDDDEDYTLPVVMRPTNMEELHSENTNKTIDSLNAEWDKVYAYLLYLEDEREKATRFGKQIELDRKIKSCNIQLEFIESRLSKLGVL